MKWFKKRPKNRRGERDRGHVLDVKLRADQVRTARLRVVTFLFLLALLTLGGFYLVWNGSEWAMNKLVYENPAFAIHDIDVETDGVLAPDQLRRWAGVKVGENLLALDLARVKRDLEMVSMIKSVALERVLPGTLRLRISEREPVAQLLVTAARTGGGFDTTVLHLDGEGCIMSLIEPRQRATPLLETNDALPLITGIDPALLAPGRRVATAQVRAALELISQFERSPLSDLVDLRQVDVSSPEVLVVTTTQGGEITLASHDLERQLRRWREIHELSQKQSKAIATLDLAVPNYIPARWNDTNSIPPFEHRVRNPQRHRRKNV